MASFLSTVKGICGKELQLISDVSTRWNSTYAMLEQAIELRDPIKYFCKKNGLAEQYSLSEYEWFKVKQLCQFLKSLDTATNAVTG
ncbi:hypothetical protein PtA15_3A556 [Puccinia triticina]|uniref:hAT-like transposase RNase-H fold domain-containing protein n=1 Tax=Puccinia triticina TaxID=208348 RepID=A0ABY7CK48_9BASI|nr:uncharacterized protein PtA15_3A556 [Puccinia triticina]WAQ83187.1 hypothetical protein PtA15_3A556 [Puccinia triticina]